MKKISEKGFVSFGQAIKDFFVGYVEFSGVSTRAGYWWAQLGLGIVYFVLFFWTIGSIASQFFMQISIFPIFLGTIFTLGVIIPNFALSVRRIRDTGIKSKAIFVIYIFYFALAYTTCSSTYANLLDNIALALSNGWDNNYYQAGTGVLSPFLLFCTCLLSIFLVGITLLPTDFFTIESDNKFLKSIFKQKNRY